MKTNDILLIGAAAVAVYLLTRPKTTATTPVYNSQGQLVNPATGVAYVTAASAAAGNTTAAEISAAGNALPDIVDSISNLF
jgi:hypothetical protein